MKIWFSELVKKIRIVVTVFLGIGVISIVAYPEFLAGANSVIILLFMIMGLIFWGGLLFLVIYFWWGHDSKCPKCKKRFCVRKTKKERYKSEDISVLVEGKSRWADGSVYATHEQYIPGERNWYKQYKVCSKCGYEFYETYSQDRAKL